MQQLDWNRTKWLRHHNTWLGYHAKETCNYLYTTRFYREILSCGPLCSMSHAGCARNCNWSLRCKCVVWSYFLVSFSLKARHYRGHTLYWFSSGTMQCDAHIICLQLDKYKIVIQLWSTSRYLIWALITKRVDSGGRG